MIILKNVSKSFGEKEVLRNISFSIAPGEIVGFVGANGSGKTTTMRSIMGLISVSAGVIEIDGEVVGRNSRTSRLLGYLPEARGLYFNETIESQLRYFGRLQGMKISECDRRTKFILNRLGIERYGMSKLRELSLGNQQRVQIAVAVLHRPRYLILDEPFSALDPTGIEELKYFLLEEKSSGTGAIFSSHTLPYIEQISQKIFILSGGQIHANLKTSPPLAEHFRQLEQRYV